MPEILAPRGATSYPLVTATLASAGGAPQAGNTVEQSLQDVATSQWLNMTTGAWQVTKDTAVKTEGQTGIHVANVDLSQLPLASQKLQAFGEVTAGPLLGLIDKETVYIDDTPKAAWDYILAGSTGVSGSAAEVLFGAGGGFTPSQVADEILERVLEPYKDQDGTLGQALYSVDATTLRALMHAAIGQMVRWGAAYKRFPCVEMFVGESVPIVAPVLQAGELADLSGAAIEWNFTNTVTGDQVLALAGTISGIPGHAEYVTAPLDGIVDAPAVWRAQAVTTLADSSVVPSPVTVVTVKAVL